MTPVALRPATPADSEFCYQLHKAAMRSYVTATWGWDEHVQREHHARAFNPSRWQIITAGGTDIGCSTSSTALTRSTWPASRSTPIIKVTASAPV